MYLILRGRRPGRVMHQPKTGINYTRILRFLIKLWTVVYWIFHKPKNSKNLFVSRKINNLILNTINLTFN